MENLNKTFSLIVVNDNWLAAIKEKETTDSQHIWKQRCYFIFISRLRLRHPDPLEDVPRCSAITSCLKLENNRKRKKTKKKKKKEKKTAREENCAQNYCLFVRFIDAHAHHI